MNRFSIEYVRSKYRCVDDASTTTTTTTVVETKVPQTVVELLGVFPRTVSNRPWMPSVFDGFVALQSHLTSTERWDLADNNVRLLRSTDDPRVWRRVRRRNTLVSIPLECLVLDRPELWGVVFETPEQRAWAVWYACTFRVDVDCRELTTFASCEFLPLDLFRMSFTWTRVRLGHLRVSQLFCCLRTAVEELDDFHTVRIWGALPKQKWNALFERHKTSPLFWAMGMKRDVVDIQLSLLLKLGVDPLIRDHRGVCYNDS